MFKKLNEKFGRTKRRAKKQPEILRYEELEQRLLFSADVVPGLDNIAVEEQVLVEDVSKEVQAEREAAQQTAAQTAAQARSELVLVNENVADYEQLISDLQGSDNKRIIEVVVLESDRDGIEQVSDILAERNDLDAIHIISHGSDGAFSLGGDWLNNSDLLANSETIAAWGNALSEDADILLYGCNVAADVDGQNLTDTLAVLTGADVAASDDKTGHEDLGADWDLEYQTDAVEASTVLDDGVPWEHTLGVVANQAPWTNLAVTTDRSTTISENYTVTATPGSDRLLLATMVTRFGFDQTIDVTSASFGGVQMHEIVEGSSDTTRNGVWMGYLLDSEIPAGEQTLTVSFTSTVSDPTGTKLLAATYVGVDQTTPINDSSANNTKLDAPISFGSQIDYVAGAEVVYVASFGGNTNTNTTEPAGYSKIYTNEWSGLLMTTIGHKDDTATAGYSPDSTAVDFEGTDANHSLAVVALNPVLNLPININTTGNTVTFTEDDSATTSLFSAAIDTIETGDTISQVVLTLANAEAGDTLFFGATSVDLNTNGATGPDAGGFTYTVSSAGANAVVTITHAGTDDATVNTMLNSLVFNNTSNNDPSTTARTVTLTSVTDSGSGTTADGTVATVNVVKANDAPTGVADSAGVNAGASVAIDVLANDSDPENDPLTARIITSTSSGTLMFNPVGLTNETNLTNNAFNDHSASWSPDGTKLAFASERDGNLEIYVMDADGTNPINLTNLAGMDTTPAWSPDGTKIAFASDRGEGLEIYVMDADGSNPARITNSSGYNHTPSWSPDGTQITFYTNRHGNDQIYVIDADGNNETRLTNNAYIDRAPKWSPDGSQIVFKRIDSGNHEIYVMNANGTGQTNLSNNAAKDSGPSWSPDGSKILFVSDRDGDLEVFSMDTDGTNQTQLTTNTAIEGVAVWSPDGLQIAYQSDRDGNQEIYVAEILSDGSFIYTPDPDFTGIDSFTYVANDGTSDSNIATVTITVNPANNAPIFIDGAVGYWNFDEGSGDSVAESAIGISTGTLGSTAGADANDPTWTTGKFGQALHFDGVNDYIEIADAPGIDISGPQFSASLWMNPDSGPNKEDMLFMKGDRQGNINYYLSWKDSGEMTWAFKDSAGWHYQDMAVTMPTTGQWNHIGITFDRPTVSLYVNGTKYVFDNVATGGSMDRDLTANDEVLWIGAGRDAGALVGVNQWSGPFTGSIDELALFDRALTDAEIEAIRTSTPPAVTASAFSIDENSANNTVVGTVVANDQDIGDTLSYAITAGNTGGAFSIDANGQIKVANSTALDFETNPTFNLTIEVDDGNGGTDSEVVTITLNDINDAPIARPDGLHLSFDGNDFIQVADATSLQMTNNVTIEAWINRDATDTGSKIIVNKEGEYELGITADTGEIKFAFAKQGTPDTWAWHNTGYFVTAGEWTHVAVTYDGVAGEAKTYINGELVDTFAQSGDLGDVYPTFNELWIGGRQNDPADRFKGQIDEVRVWSTTRTQGEIQASMGGQLTGGELGLAGNWRLDEAFGSVAVDQSASGNNNGVLGGSEGAAATPTYQGYFISEDSLLTVSAGLGLLANDFDADGDTLTVTNINTTGMLGSLVVNAADGSFTYDPRGVLDSLGAGERLRETFTYTANDGSVNSSPVTVTIVVVGANDAPVIGGANDLTAIGEDPVSNDGTLVSDLIAGQVTDLDSGALSGIAVIAVDDTNGIWQYTTNSGGLWTDFASPSESTARLLAADASTYVRFVPNTDWNGTVTNGITFHAWDQTSGINGGTAVLGSTLRDEFSTVAYNNSDGSEVWTTSWIENDADGGGAASGLFFVDTDLNLLQFSESDPGAWIYREADLSGATAATFSFVLDNRLGGGGNIAVQVSGDGGSNFTTLTNIVNSTPNGTLSFDITDYIASNTQIRFYDVNGGGKEILIDDVQIGIVSLATTGGSTAFSSAMASSSITVTAVDDAAVITGDISYSGSEGDAVAGDMDAIDAEGLTDGTYFTVTTPATNGTAAIDAASGAWTFTPTDPNWFGSDAFTVTVTDDLGGTTTQVVSITLANVDDGAVITGDVSYSGNEGDAAAGDLNATDVDGLTDTTYFTISAQGSNGTAAIDAETGAWTFTPTDPNWFGSDSFTVTVTDDLGGTTTQVMSITLANVNDAPVMTAWFNDAWDTRKGLTINAASVAGDVTNFPVLITLNVDAELAEQALANGDDILFTAADGTSQLAHEIEFFDETTGELRVWVKTDLSGSVDTNIFMYFGNSASGNQENIPGVWDNYVGVYHLSESPTGAPGELADSSGSGNNATAEGAMDAADSVSTTIGQGLAFDGSNDMIRIPDSATLDSINDEATFSLWINFVDAADGDTQIIMSSNNRYSGWDGYEWANQGDGDHFFYPDAMMPDVNYNLGANPFTNGDWHHLAATMDFANQEVKIYVDGTPMTFTYEGVPGNWTSLTSSDDLLFGGNPDRATRFFNGMMDEIRIADVARSQEWIQTEVNNQSAPGSFFSIGAAADRQNTLTDINEDDFTSAGDTVMAIINSSGADRITDDDAGAVEGIAVTGVDDTNGEWQYDANADGTWLAFGSVTDSNAVLLDTGALVRFVPDADYNGTAGDLTFHAWDQTSGANGNTGIDVSTNGGDTAFSTETFNATLNVIPVDDAAVITGDISYVGNEGDVVAGDLNATDVDGLTDTTYFTVSSAATKGTAVIDAETGAWSFTPTDSNWFGTDSFEVTVTDDLGGTTTQLVSITLANVDDAAVITGDVSFSGNEGDAVSGDLNATDVDGLTDGTYFTVSSAATNGTAVINATTGAWSFTPTDANWFGSDSFTVTVTDDLGGTTTQVVNITMANVDDAAVISGDISFTGNEGDAVSGTMGATDVDGLTDTTYFSVTSAATNGSAVIDAETGAWSFTPTDPNWFGSDSFEVTITDDLGGTTTQVVNITLANVDDAAVITGDISFTGDEGDVVSGTIGATDVDGLTDATYFTVTSAATNGSAVIDTETGAWSFTPTDPNWFGSDSFTVTVTDDLGGTTTQVVNITLANVDDAAVITGDISYSGNEGDAVSGDLNATDVEGLTDTTYFTISAQGSNGTAAIDAETGAWTFTPTDLNWFGSDSFTVTVTDDLGGTTTQVVNITLANVDDAAVISGDISFTGNEGDAVSGTMGATDVDGLTDSTYFTVSSAATNGTAAINAETGAWTFTPTDPNWFGSDSFTVTVTDDLGGTTTQVVSITLSNDNDPAVITGDVSYSGNEGDAVAGDLNATDVDGLTDGTYFSVTTPATNGTTAIDATTGTWSFTPTDPNWFGSDSFTVTVTDDLGGTTTQVVNITLSNVDDSAVISGDISFSGNEGDAVSGAMGATDVDGLTDSTYFTVSSAATNGTAAINAETGAWTFTPTDPNWFGSDSFTVTVTDDLGGTTTQVVNITLANVDDASVITGDVSYSGNEGDVVAGDLNATDVEGLTDTTYFSVTTPATNGTAAIDATTGAWTFTPTDPNWFGSDAFTVTVTDDLGGTTTQVVNITLANVDDTAVISGDISFTGNEGDAVSGDMDATDAEGLTDGTYFTVTTPATNGTAAIDAATGAWTFTPTDANWFGSDAFTVTVTDDLGGTTTQVVNITLANVDDASVITGDVSYSGNEGDAVAGDMDATDVDGLTDTTYFSVTTPATNGTAAIDATTGAWTFTPSDPNWFGSDSFTVTVTDDLGGTTTQVVSITLANVDDSAVISGDISFTGNEGDAVAGDLNATDVDGLTDTTYFTVSAQGSNGTAAIDPASGAWTFTPTDPNWFGSDAFTVTVTDDLGGMTTQVVNITLANVDDSAVITGDVSYAGNEGDAVSGTMGATDVDGLTDSTYFTVSSAATNGTAAIDPASGAWTFTPTDPNWFGSDAFTVTVTDDLGGTTTQVVNITLANVDDSAVISGDISFTGNEGDAVAGDLNATDVDGLTDTTYFTVSAQGSNGTAAIDPASGAWTFTPTDPNWFGSDAFTVTVTDDLGGTTTQVVDITLANVDDSAVITGDVSYAGNEGDAVSGTMGATDVDGLTDTTYFTVSAQGSNGTAAIDAETGAWTFTPTAPNWFGSDTFTVTVTDDLGGTTTQVVSITLANANDPAVISGDVSYSGNEGDAVSGDMDATDVDGLTDTTYFTVSSPGSNGAAAIDAETGAWTFTPTDPNWFGSDTFTVTVTDDLGGTTTQVVSITLANVDDTAVITGDVSYSGNEGDAVAGDLNATDVEGLTDTTYFTVSSAATNGSAVIDAETGAWSFTPTDPNWFGTDSFEVTVTDDFGGTTTQLISITLANVDDAAVITGDISFSGNEGDAVSGDLNATDVEGLTDTTYFTVSSAATNGSAVIDAETGAWTFTPSDPNWFGSDSFTVTVTDDLGGTTTQVVNVTLANVDDGAVITGDVSYSGNEGDAVAGDLNATDVDGLTDTTYFTVSAQGSNGTAAIDAETGVWTFTPSDPNWFGSDAFTVTVTDDLGGTTTQVVNITLANVDDGAVITGDVSFSGNEGDAVAGDLNATDVDGLTDTTYFSVTTPATNGTAAIDATTGAWTFTPTDPNWFGSDNFTVTVTDDLGGTTTQVVSITLSNVDDAAVITGAVSYSGNEGDAVAGDMDATDVEGLTDGTYFTVTTPATNGTAAIDATTGAWTFTPTDPNWFGSDAFTVTVTDDLGGTTTQVVNITLANVDDAAVISGDISFTGNEGDAVSGTMGATDVEGLTDSTYFSVTTPATNGTAAINAETGAWTFTPTDPNWFGSDAFTVTVTDDLGGTTTQVVNITLANVDDAAVISGDISFTGNEGDAVSGTMGATDVDGLTDSTYFTVSSAATNGTAAINAETGAWTFTPTDPNWFGSDSFTVTVTDDLGGTTTQVVNITLANVDDASVITGDVSYSGNEGDVVAGDLNATDVDGLTDTTYFTVSAQGSNGTAAIDPASGAWTFTPADPNWFGSDSFTVTVTDDLGGTTTQAVSITLANVNDAPSAVDDNVSGNEDTVVVDNILSNDNDVDGDALTTSAVSGPNNGSLTLNADGSFSYTPNANWNGTDSFTYIANDGALDSNVAAVTITVNPVNDLPTVTSSAVTAATEDAAYSYTITTGDVDGDAMTITAPVLPAWLTLVDNGDGTATLSGTPTNAEVGDHSVVLQVSDSSSTDTQNFTLNVSEATIVPPIVGTDPGPIFEDPEPDDDDDSDVDDSTNEEPDEDPLAEDVPVPPVEDYLIPEDSSDADDSFVLTKDPDAQETEEIIYLSDEVDTDIQSEEREDDNSYVYFDNNFYKEIISAKHLNFNSNTPENTLELSELADSGVVDFASDDWQQVVAKEDYILLREEIDETFSSEQQSNAVKANIVTASMTTFTVGIASYFLRAGSMVSSLMSSLPLWRGFDPIAIFVGKKKRKKDRNELPNTDKSKSETLFDGEAE